ncbi:MAG: monovalent cation/H+ antiporter subunit E [Burkholderiales bacterium]|nr:monovalent cation/H+ antiporter subunit E [Burkholderiales bacterium]
MKLFLALLAFWLVLQQSAAAGDLLLGIAAAGLAALAYARLRLPARRPRLRVRALLELFALFIDDVVRSNIAVAAIVLGMHRGPRKAGFLPIPLELRDPRGLAILAGIITATPGTSWARYDAAASVLTIHVLDLRDGEAWVRAFKSRYERRLLEIFA